MLKSQLKSKSEQKGQAAKPSQLDCHLLGNANDLILISESQTGQLFQSTIENCPVFIPNKYTQSIVSKLTLKEHDLKLTGLKDTEFDDQLQLYFYKFFAGNKSLVKGFADIAMQDLYLWNTAKIAQGVYIKTVANAAQLFAQVVENFKNEQNFTSANLIKQNKKLRPKESSYGIRNKGMKAGNPQTNKYAFYCVPSKQINALFTDLLDYINDNLNDDLENRLTNTNNNTISTALIGMMQFIYIHPFKDGNGRISRALFLSIMQKEFGLNFSCLLMLYLKNINRVQYYAVMQDYREGDIDSLRRFYLTAINWANKSSAVLSGLLAEYRETIGELYSQENKIFTQVVVKLAKNDVQSLDQSIFELYSSKGGNNIYINTPLLSCFNQFDYYLRHELRQHLQGNEGR